MTRQLLSQGGVVSESTPHAHKHLGGLRGATTLIACTEECLNLWRPYRPG
jgi:hypothetical protein